MKAQEEERSHSQHQHEPFALSKGKTWDNEWQRGKGKGGEVEEEKW